MPEPKPPSATYAEAGVSIDRGNELVDRIREAARRTARPGVMGGIGGFGALFDLASLSYRDPVLVSGTDGVGTKIRLAIESGRHDRIGVDLVAMCVNDLVVQGAEPLFFLDYFACGALDVDVAERVVAGIAEGCRMAGCALVGGETAEMPGMYALGDYDLAGFCVGVVERDGVIDGRGIRAGDALIGIASSGPHSNGYSLIRKLLADSGTHLDDAFDGGTFADALLEPTRIYVRPVLDLAREVPVKGVAHITGGGLLENLPRVLPDETAAVFSTGAWPRPAIFDWLRETGNISFEEMHRTFNCGLGMVIVVGADDTGRALQVLADAGEQARPVGEIRGRAGGGAVILE